MFERHRRGSDEVGGSHRPIINKDPCGCNVSNFKRLHSNKIMELWPEDLCDVFVEASARTIKQPTSSDISTAFISYFSTYDWTAFSAYIPTYKVFISTSTLSLLHFKTVFVRKRLTSTLAFWGYFYIHLCLRWITCTREKQLSSSLSTFQLAKKKSASQQTSGEEWDRHSWQTKTLFYFQDVWQQNRKARIFLL